MVAATTMARADHVGWAKARNAPCPRGSMQVIPCPRRRQDGSMIIISKRGHGARFRAWTGPTNLPGRAPLPTLRFLGTSHWRSEVSRLDRPLGHDDGVAADGRGNEPPGGDLHREADQARPAHLVALLDHDRVGALAQAAREPAGKGGRRRTRPR